MTDLNTPLWKLTAGEFLELIERAKQKAGEEPVKVTDYTGDRYVHGISGIARLLGCSKTTVWQYRQEGWLNPAISQLGRNIICDASLALELFKQQNITGKTQIPKHVRFEDIAVCGSEEGKA
jgi:hypothetical protein